MLLPLGAAAAVAANGVRVALLVLVGASGRPELAFGGFHSKLGWLLFVGIALASVAAAERLPLLRRAGARGPEPALPEGAGAFLAPFLAMLATALVTSAWAAGPLDRAYGARVVAGGLALARRALPSAARPAVGRDRRARLVQRGDRRGGARLRAVGPVVLTSAGGSRGAPVRGQRAALAGSAPAMNRIAATAAARSPTAFRCPPSSVSAGCKLGYERPSSSNVATSP